jgi:threonine dehydratase
LTEIPTAKEIRTVADRLRPYIHRTPVLTSSSINNICGAELFFKCENLQKAGAFKFRGATNAVMTLKPEETSRGVATHSSGNHAAALSLAAQNRGLKAFIVMPRNAPEIKVKAVQGYGGQITLCEPTLASREEILQKLVRQTGAIFIHPYNNPQVIMGQATACLELLEECPNLDMIISPVSGGGLLSGTAISAALFSSGTAVVGAEPAGADDACRSLKAGKIIPLANPDTICDGLRASLGTLPFSYIRTLVDDILTAADNTIIMAMHVIWERMKIIVEPSAAVTLAVMLEHAELFKDRRVGLILSGGNVNLEKLPW